MSDDEGNNVREVQSSADVDTTAQHQGADLEPTTEPADSGPSDSASSVARPPDEPKPTGYHQG